MPYSFLNKTAVLLSVTVLVLLASLIEGDRVLACGGPAGGVCVCVNRTVECTNQQLTEIPSGIPTNTITLKLRNNQIERLRASDLKGLVELQELDLRQNRISIIEDGAFSNLPLLNDISLQSNRLRSINDSTFQSATSLRFLQLTSNLITTFDPRAAETFPSSLETIFLSSNQLRCTCATRNISQLAHERKFKIQGDCKHGADSYDIEDLRVESVFAYCSGGSPYNAVTRPHQVTTFRPSVQSSLPSSSRLTTVPSSTRHTLPSYSTRHTSPASFSTKPPTSTLIPLLCASRTPYENTTTFEHCEEQEFYCKTNVVTLFPSGSQVATGGCASECTAVKQCGTQAEGKCTDIACCHGYKCNNESMSAIPPLRIARYIVSSKWTIWTPWNEPNLVQDLRDYFDSLYTSVFFEVNAESETRCYNKLMIEGCYSYLFVKAYAQESRLDFTDESIGRLLSAYQISREGELRNLSVTRPLSCRKDRKNTLVGQYVYEICPNRTRGDMGQQRAYLYCVIDESTNNTIWTDADISSCPSEHTQHLEDLLSNLTSTIPGSKEDLPGIDWDPTPIVRSVDEMLAQSAKSFSPLDLTLLSEIMSQSLDNSHPSMEQAPLYMSSFNRMSRLDPTNLRAAHQNNATARRMVKLIEKFTDRLQLGGDACWKMTSGDLYVEIVDVDQANQSYTLETNDVSVELPFAAIEGRDARLKFIIYKSSNLFEVLEGKARTRQSNTSYIVSASIGDQPITNLSDTVNIRFSQSEGLKANTEATCVYWDWESESWLSDGVSTVQDGDTIVCESNHLTNFALLFDVNPYGAPPISDQHIQILTIISYTGCAISLVSLGITLVTYILFRKLRKDNPSKILMNLCASLFLLNLFFIALTHFKDDPIMCKVSAVLIHYALLASFTWMAIEAFYMYIALILVFTYIKKFVLKILIVGWGAPLVVVIATLSISVDNYTVVQGQICWMTMNATYGAVVAPVFLVIIVNIITFIMVVRQLQLVRRRRQSVYSDSGLKKQTNDVRTQLRGALSVFVLLGLTWTFAGFVVFRTSVAFQYLFAIFNSLQGFFLFLFYCILKREVHIQCLRFLPCFEYDGEYTVSSTAQKSSNVASNRLQGSATKSTTLDSISSVERRLQSDGSPSSTMERVSNDNTSMTKV